MDESDEREEGEDQEEQINKHQREEADDKSDMKLTWKLLDVVRLKHGAANNSEWSKRLTSLLLWLTLV